MEIKVEYKPVLESIYLISRSFDNKTKSWDIWSSPKVIESIKYNDVNKIKELRNAFKKPSPVENEFGYSKITIGQETLKFLTGRTQIKICLPAGTILETFNV